MSVETKPFIAQEILNQGIAHDFLVARRIILSYKITVFLEKQNNDTTYHLGAV